MLQIVQDHIKHTRDFVANLQTLGDISNLISYIRKKKLMLIKSLLLYKVILFWSINFFC